MKSFDTELQKYADKVRLRAAERRVLRERILSYMEYHPLPKEKRVIGEELTSQPFYAVHFNTLYFKFTGAALLLFVVLGVPLLAERSVPGDVLYLVKTGINENVQAQFANSPYEKVAFETKLMERRISEARLLASEGKLTEEVEAEIAKDVQGHADAAQVNLEALRESDADEAAIAEITYGSALEVQSAVLDSGANEMSSSTDSIRNVVMLAQVHAIERRSGVLPSYERLIARIEMETTRAVELYETVKDSATEEERKNIERRFDDINRNITDARDVAETDKTEAVTELSKSLALIQKLIVFMTDIDVRENVSLEDLVPVDLTDEERVEAIREIFTEIQTLQEEVESRIPLIEETNLSEKVILGNADLKRKITMVQEALDTDDIDQAESALADAYAIVLDLDALTTPYAPEGESTTSPATTTPEFGIPGEEGEAATTTGEAAVEGVSTSTDEEADRATSTDDAAPETAVSDE